MKKHLKLTTLIMAAVMVLSLTAFNNPTNAAPAKALNKTYTFGYNNFGQGAYPLDMNEKETTYALKSVGMNIKVANNEFTVDKLITDAQNLISSKIDGMIVWSASDTLYSSFNNLCKTSKTPFVLGDKYPLGENTKKMLRENPYFAGAISTQDADAGAQLAKRALKDGRKTAIIVAAAAGDTNHDLRVAGFTKAFEQGGGKVVGVVHCADPSEAVQKSNDLLTANPKADCLYGSGGDFSMGALSAMKSTGIKMPIYGTDIDPNVLKAIKTGEVIEANGAAGPYCAGIAGTLLLNYLDGHKITDASGKAFMSNGLKFVTVTKATADTFEKYWLKGHPFKASDFKALCYRYNKKVTYKDYEKFLNTYNYTNRVAALKK